MGSAMPRTKTVHLYILGFCVGVCMYLVTDPLIEQCASSASTEDSNAMSTEQVLTDPTTTARDAMRYNLAPEQAKVSGGNNKPRNLIRPRYFATELGIKEKLLVVVLSTPQTVGTLAVALNRTLTQHGQKVVYFVDDVGHGNRLPVSMPGIVAFVDKVAALRTSHVLKYVATKYADEYDFFFVTRDTTYVQIRTLLNLVKRVSASEDVYMGVPAKENHKFCSLDGGVLLSNSVLKKVSMRLDWCARNSNSDNDDINLGSCVSYATDLHCQRSVKEQKFNALQLEPKSTSSESFWKSALNYDLTNVITVSPIEDPASFYSLHIIFAQEELKAIHMQLSALQSSITNMSHLTPESQSEVTWPVGSNRFHKATKRFDVPKWNYFNETHIFSDNDFNSITTLQGIDKLDITDVIRHCLHYVQEEHHERIEEVSVINGYRKFDPTRGMDYIVDIAIHDPTGQYVQERLELSRPLSKVEVVPMPYVTENTRINMILPTRASEMSSAQSFIAQYVKVCMELHGNTFLMLLLLYDIPESDPDPFQQLKKLALDHSIKYKRESMKIGWTSRPSTSTLTAIDSVVKKFPPDSLILLCRPEMHLHDDYLNRVRMNTIKDWQVFSPVPFAKYSPDVAMVDETQGHVSRSGGHFDTYNYDHLSFYAADYLRAKKMAQVAGVNILQAYNGESNDKEIYDVFLEAKDIHIMRAVEPRLLLDYHPVDCYKKSANCGLQKSGSLGTRAQLAALILDYKKES